MYFSKEYFKFHLVLYPTCLDCCYDFFFYEILLIKIIHDVLQTSLLAIGP